MLKPTTRQLLRIFGFRRQQIKMCAKTVAAVAQHQRQARLQYSTAGIVEWVRQGEIATPPTNQEELLVTTGVL